MQLRAPPLSQVNGVRPAGRPSSSDRDCPLDTAGDCFVARGWHDLRVRRSFALGGNTPDSFVEAVSRGFVFLWPACQRFVSRGFGCRWQGTHNGVLSSAFAEAGGEADCGDVVRSACPAWGLEDL
jgi:hypothetical protein